MTAQPRPDVSVLVVSLNVRELLIACLSALYRHRGDVAIEVILVDNASSDGTVEAVRERFPFVRIVVNEGNAGFARANNQALALARGRYVLYLNPDTEIGQRTLATCVEALELEPRLGMVGCRLVYPDGRIQFEGGRRHYRLIHLVWEAFYLHVLFPRSAIFAHQLMGGWDHRTDRDVEAISGAFMFVRTEVARDVGGMPEDVFLYHEDLSICLRVRRRGWRIRYLANVETLHHGGMVTRKVPLRLSLLEGEVRVRLIRERSGPVAGAAARVLFGFRACVRLVLAAVGSVLPGLRRVRERSPGAFDVRKYTSQLLWTVSPSSVADLMPRPEVVPSLQPVEER